MYSDYPADPVGAAVLLNFYLGRAARQGREIQPQNGFLLLAHHFKRRPCVSDFGSSEISFVLLNLCKEGVELLKRVIFAIASGVESKWQGSKHKKVVLIVWSDDGDDEPLELLFVVCFHLELGGPENWLGPP